MDAITEKVIACAFRVSNELGAGFSEKVYENALFHEISKSGLEVIQQHRMTVIYDGIEVGNYVADLLVENQVLVELKALAQLTNEHLAQCLNYLKATGHKVCLLINFGKAKVEVKRVVNNF